MRVERACSVTDVETVQVALRLRIICVFEQSRLCVDVDAGVCVGVGANRLVALVYVIFIVGGTVVGIVVCGFSVPSRMKVIQYLQYFFEGWPKRRIRICASKYKIDEMLLVLIILDASAPIRNSKLTVSYSKLGGGASSSEFSASS